MDFNDNPQQSSAPFVSNIANKLTAINLSNANLSSTTFQTNNTINNPNNLNSPLNSDSFLNHFNKYVKIDLIFLLFSCFLPVFYCLSYFFHFIIDFSQFREDRFSLSL